MLVPTPAKSSMLISLVTHQAPYCLAATACRNPAWLTPLQPLQEPASLCPAFLTGQVLTAVYFQLLPVIIKRAEVLQGTTKAYKYFNMLQGHAHPLPAMLLRATHMNAHAAASGGLVWYCYCGAVSCATYRDAFVT
jgi:hypothetical protein